MEEAHTFGAWLKRRRKSLRLTQKELAQQVGYAEVTLRKVEADELRPSWQMAERLAEALQIPPKDQTQFVRYARDEGGQPADVSPGQIQPAVARSRLVAAAAQVDWGDAPDASGVLGRQIETEQLRRWLVDERCRLVAVLGMGGIGKTALATAITTNVQEQFSAVIWRSLRNAPPLAELLRQCIQVLSNPEAVPLPATADQWIALFMEHLQRQRCLLVLDNFETVLQAERPGHYLPGYEGYGQLLRQIGEGRHQSCLLLTSREKPKELIPLAGEMAPVRALVLASLDLADGRALLRDRGLRGRAHEWAALHERYSGNPLALQIVSETIRELFDGDIAQFLSQETILFDGINDLLAQQLARLSPLEQEVMFWLAVEREPITAEELANDLVPRPTQAVVLATLHALRQRFLVERSQSGFTLQNVVLEYFTAAMVEQVCEEIRSGSAALLQRHALLKATAKSYVRESQRTLLLAPIAQRVVEQMGRLKLMEQLSAILSHLRHAQPRQPGYIGGNVLNLLVQLDIDLRGQDFSQLAVWQADLRNVTAHDADFRQADLSHCVFTETFAVISSVAFSPDGEQLAAVTKGNEIRVWRVNDSMPMLAWVAHHRWASSLSFSSYGNVLASGGGDRAVRLWNTQNGRHLATLEGHTRDVVSVCFSPNSNVLASGSMDRTVRMWDVHTGQCLHILQGHTSEVTSVCFSSDGDVVATASNDSTVRLWDVHNCECLRVLQGHTGSVWSICFSPDGSMLASTGEDQTVRLWDVHTGQCLHIWKEHRNDVWSVCFSPDDNVLASGSSDQTVRLWDMHTGQHLHTLQGHTNWVRSVCFSPDGRVLASGSMDRTVRLWDVHTGQCLHTLQGYMNNVWSVCFSPDGIVLASGSDDPAVRLWDAHTGECLHTLQGHTHAVKAVCFSPDGSVLASGGEDPAVRLWDVHTGQCLHTLQGHTNAVRSVAFSPDGRVLASGSDDETIWFWDVNTGVCLRTLRGHTSWVWSVCFSPDGSVLGQWQHGPDCAAVGCAHRSVPAHTAGTYKLDMVCLF